MDAIQADQNTNIVPLKAFLRQFLPWELEELAAVYDFLELACFQHSHPTKEPRRAKSYPQTAAARYYAAYRIGTFAHEPLDVITIPSLMNDSVHEIMTSNRYPMDVDLTPISFGGGTSSFKRNVRRAAVRARILSQGLIFLRAFQQQSLYNRKRTEEHLIDLRTSMGDKFIHAALYSLKDGKNYFAPERELITHAHPRP